MIVFPNAKINLGLHVLRKRSDGFHDLETVFYPVPLCDILEIIIPDATEKESNTHSEKWRGRPEPAVVPLKNGKTLKFSSSGIDIAGDIELNLCVKACKLFDERFGLDFDVEIHLHKIIPSGAGLGGGSSDGSFTLKILNELHGNKASGDQLMAMSLELGSDCPFFLVNQPVAAGGRGEKMKPLSINLKGLSIVIVKPETHISTALAFSGITPAERSVSPDSIVSGPLNSWNQKLKNDFEGVVFSKYPEIGEIKKKMIEKGALYASMSGSGSAVFGIFNGTVPDANEFGKMFYFSGTL